MIIYLVQHGEAMSEEEDPRRPLSPEGRRNVEAVARVAAGRGISPGRILHSGKRRAAETAEILGRAMDSSLEVHPGLAPMDPVEPMLRWLGEVAAQGVQSVCLVGHLPFLDRLAARLVTGDPGRSVLEFRYGALVQLVPRRQGEGYRVAWVLTPEFALAVTRT